MLLTMIKLDNFEIIIHKVKVPHPAKFQVLENRNDEYKYIDAPLISCEFFHYTSIIFFTDY